MQNSIQKQSAELKAAKKRLAQSEKRVSELDKLFTRLYEDNVSGKISDERFEMMSKNCEVEQKELRQIIPELSQFIEASEQKKAYTEHSSLTFASVSMLRSQLLSLTVWFTTKKERLRRIFLHNLSVHTIKLLYRPSLKSETAFLFVYQSTDYFGHDA